MRRAEEEEAGKGEDDTVEEEEEMVEEVEEEAVDDDEEKLAIDFFLDSNEVLVAEPVFVRAGYLRAKKWSDLCEERN